MSAALRDTRSLPYCRRTVRATTLLPAKAHGPLRTVPAAPLAAGIFLGKR